MRSLLNCFRTYAIFYCVVFSIMIFVYIIVLSDLSMDQSTDGLKKRSLRPAFKISKGRAGVSFLLAIPTVKRDKKNYLLDTLDNIFVNMDEEEQKDSMIVVFIAETDMDYVREMAEEIRQRFGKYCDSGVLEVISPPASYYPNMDTLRITLNDTMDRVKWRSKQNLDYSFLMNYAFGKSEFYVQLEDDIITKKGFINLMRKAINNSTSNGDSWFLLDFCDLGFIGKLFRSSDLPDMATYFKLFFNDQPVDWLLTDFMKARLCNIEPNFSDCVALVNKLKPLQFPRLFQHKGIYSSLKGKTQPLKDRYFKED